MQEEVRLFDGDLVIEILSRGRARELSKAGQIYFINHGKDARVLRPIQDERTDIEKVAGWKIMREMLNTALNRGRVGQFCIGYPIPYAHEGRFGVGGVYAAREDGYKVT
jgi:hypothetical protein